MKTNNITPWAYIPTTYFMEGLPYAVINILSAVLYTKMKIPNDVFIFWTSWLYLPWVLKMLWAPLVEGNKTKRAWIISTQYAIALVFLFIAFILNTPHFFMASVLGFFVGAFLSATHDIALDGYYMIALNEQKQAFFVGWRVIFYRFAMIFTSGPLVVLAGKLEKTTSITTTWAIVMCTLAVAGILFTTYHQFILPRPAADGPQHAKSTDTPIYMDIFKSYFSQKNIIYILLFILLYRMGDAFLEKVVVPFILKPVDTGALGISTEAFGWIKGTLGLIAIIMGNISGGWLLSRFGFRKCIWWFALILVLPNFFYLYMAYTQPSLTTVGALLIVEHFGNGLAMMALSVFIMFVSQGKYKTSYYAISTSIMALGMMLPNMMSGKLQVSLGYQQFFLVISIMSLITFAVVPLAYKIKQLDDADKFISQHSTSEMME